MVTEIFAVKTRNIAAEADTELHFHDEGQLMFCSAGGAWVTAGQRRWYLAPGFALWIPPLMEHAAHFVQSGNIGAIYVPKTACSDGLSTIKSILLNDLMKELITYAVTLKTKAPLSGTDQKIVEVILDLLERAPSMDLSLLANTHDKRLKKALHLVLSSERVPSLTELSSKAHVSVRTLERLWHQEFKTSFREWKRRFSMILALQSFANGNDVTTTSLHIGYQSLSAFINAFKKTFGVPPSMCKKK